jgi:hypothetical protein
VFTEEQLALDQLAALVQAGGGGASVARLDSDIARIAQSAGDVALQAVLNDSGADPGSRLRALTDYALGERELALAFMGGGVTPQGLDAVMANFAQAWEILAGGAR